MTAVPTEVRFGGATTPVSGRDKIVVGAGYVGLLVGALGIAGVLNFVPTHGDLVGQLLALILLAALAPALSLRERRRRAWRILFLGIDYVRIEIPAEPRPDREPLTFDKEEHWFRYDEIASIEARSSTIAVRFVGLDEPVYVLTHSSEEAARAAALFRERAAAHKPAG
ncbi:MAG TPA: hypothetical protein VG496_04305 [Myxococcales bacterium]|nr:hypothetical protein [Myxococcales bacterium]